MHRYGRRTGEANNQAHVPSIYIYEIEKGFSDEPIGRPVDWSTFSAVGTTWLIPVKCGVVLFASSSLAVMHLARHVEPRILSASLVKELLRLQVSFLDFQNCRWLNMCAVSPTIMVGR